MRNTVISPGLHYQWYHVHVHVRLKLNASVAAVKFRCAFA